MERWGTAASGPSRHHRRGFHTHVKKSRTRIVYGPPYLDVRSMYNGIFKDFIGSKGIVYCDKNSYVSPVYYSMQCDQSYINMNARADLFVQIVRNRLCGLCDI